jgi:TP901 family phage tail tape measure protein
MPGLSGEVANLIVALKLDDRGFSGKLNGIARQLKGMDAGLSQMGRGAGQLGSGLARLGAVAATAAAGGLTAVITTAASFEQAFTGVEKTVDGTAEQLGELEETIRGMARNMPIAFEELAAIGEAGGALGVAREDLEEFIDVVARLSVSTNLSSDQAATALGQLGTILDLSGGDFEDFADTLVALGNAGASTEDQIVEMAARFAAAGNSAGLSNDQILTLASSVASMGVEVEAGGSSLSRLFNNTTTNIGVANEKAESFAEALGLTFSEFKEAWRDDALGTFEDLLGKLNELDQFEGAALLKSIGITNTRDVNTILLMAQNMDFLAEQTLVAAEANGALREESDKFFDTAQGQWKTFINIIRDSAAIIGEELLPVTKDVLGELSAALDNPETREKLRKFGQDLAEGIRTLVDTLKTTDWSALVSSMKGAADVAKGAFAAFNALPDPVKQLAIAAIVGNKVTGGALGQIASGLGNLLGGALKLAIPALSRGVTPANPLFVKEVGLGGGPGGPGGKNGGGGVLGNLLRVLGVVAAAAAARQLEPVIQDFAEEVHDSAGFDEDWNPFKGAGPEDWQWPLGSKNPPKWLPDWLGGPPPVPEGFSGQIPGAPGGGGAAGPRSVGGSWAGDKKLGATLDKLGTLPDTAILMRDGINALPDTAMMTPPMDALTQTLPPILSTTGKHLATAHAQSTKLDSIKTIGAASSGKLDSIKSLQSSGNSKLDGIKAFEASNSGKLSGILAKKSSVTVNTTVNTSVKISATITKQAVESVTSSISGGSTGGQIAI